ncbi:MAG: class I SAM-dependent methyltransferase, partial [Planctomycetes bacterium]|nr:class I SAM-dependent methyltransferase [Planctomycetota bacterium]
GEVLHVGCGFGVNPLIVAGCARRVRQVRGVDPDVEKIEVFRWVIARLGARRVSADVGFGEQLPYENNSFDRVICNESISHVESIPCVLAEIHRTLRPGGLVVISDTAKWNPYALWFKYGRLHLDENYQSKRGMQEYLTGSGFRDIYRVPAIVAPRNPLRTTADRLWWLHRWIDPKYVLVAKAA